jgi:endonuclease/exonuclease/phosphatase family metal-dependent hydrolase
MSTAHDGTPRDVRRWHLVRRLVVFLLAAVLAVAGLVGASSASEATRDRPGQKLRVINYNIRYGAGLDGVVDLERTADVIRRSGAQIATIQEVDRHLLERSDFEDQARRLARMLRWHVVFGPAIDWDPLEKGEPRRQYGVAILSRFPIRDSENVRLPIHGIPRPPPGEEEVEPWSEPRAVLRALIDVRGVRVNVYTTHLQANSTALRFGDEPSDHESAQQQRAEQVEAILDEIDRVGGLTILAGDLNARPDDPELEPLYDAGLLDAWDVAGDGPGYTIIGVNDDGEFEAVGRIDYVFVSPEIGVRAAKVPWTEASDHLPVVADLRLPRSHGGVGSPRDP